LQFVLFMMVQVHADVSLLIVLLRWQSKPLVLSQLSLLGCQMDDRINCCNIQSKILKVTSSNFAICIVYYDGAGWFWHQFADCCVERTIEAIGIVSIVAWMTNGWENCLLQCWVKKAESYWRWLYYYDGADWFDISLLIAIAMQHSKMKCRVMADLMLEVRSL
jgi:hypothetical protein